MQDNKEKGTNEIESINNTPMKQQEGDNQNQHGAGKSMEKGGLVDLVHNEEREGLSIKLHNLTHQEKQHKQDTEEEETWRQT